MAEKLPIRLENLKNKSIIVTGGASGLGLATATKFAESGAYVTIADIQEEAGSKIASGLADKGYKVTFVRVDVSDWNSSLAAFKHAVNFSPRKTLDVAALFAGLAKGTEMAQEVALADPEPSIDRDPVAPNLDVLNVNLLGSYICSQLALHYFRLKPSVDGPEVVGKKSLILVSSLAGYLDYGQSQYATSKFGVRGLFRTIAFANKKADSNFRVNVLAPGFVETPLVTGLPGAELLLGMIGERKLWVPIEHVVDAASLCATNEEVNGRSFGIWPYGFFDAMEDVLNGYGGSDFLGHLEKSGYLEVTQ